MGVQGRDEGNLKPRLSDLSMSFLGGGGGTFQFPNIISLREYELVTKYPMQFGGNST